MSCSRPQPHDFPVSPTMPRQAGHQSEYLETPRILRGADSADAKCLGRREGRTTRASPPEIERVHELVGEENASDLPRYCHAASPPHWRAFCGRRPAHSPEPSFASSLGSARCVNWRWLRPLNCTTSIAHPLRSPTTGPSCDLGRFIAVADLASLLCCWRGSSAPNHLAPLSPLAHRQTM